MLPTIIILNKSDDRAPLHIEREWHGPVPVGWVQVGYVAEDGYRYVDYALQEEA